MKSKILNSQFLIVVICCFLALNEAKKNDAEVIIDALGEVAKLVGQAAEHVGPVLNQAAEHVGPVLNQAGNAIGRFGHHAAENIGPAMRQAGKFMRRAGDRASDFAGDAVNATGHVARDAVDTLGDAFSAENLRNAAHTVEHGLNHAVHEMKDAANDAGKALKHAAREERERRRVERRRHLHQNRYNPGHDDYWYCHHCRSHRQTCHCNSDPFWYSSSNAHNRRYHHNNHHNSFWPRSSRHSTAARAKNLGSLSRDEEFNQTYEDSQIITLGCPKPSSFFERHFGNWIKWSDLIKKISDDENVDEADYIDKQFYFENQFELLVAVRECLINQRERTLRKLLDEFGLFMPDEVRIALVAWFFHELNGPFDEAAKDMATALCFDMELDINAPYQGKTAMHYALENFNADAFEWIHQHGGQLGHENKGDIIPIRSDVAPLTVFQNVRSFQAAFEKFHLDHMIRFDERRNQFVLSFENSVLEEKSEN